MWRFQQVTCQAFEMPELLQEMAGRQRKETVANLSGHRRKPARSGPLSKTFNINTYKFHALGDYEKMIRQFGTTDSYTTEVVSVPSYFLSGANHDM